MKTREDEKQTGVGADWVLQNISKFSRAQLDVLARRENVDLVEYVGKVLESENIGGNFEVEKVQRKVTEILEMFESGLDSAGIVKRLCARSKIFLAIAEESFTADEMSLIYGEMSKSN